MLFHFGRERTDRLVFPLLILTVVLWAALGGIAPILAQLEAYVFRKAFAQESLAPLKFFNVVQTVREAGSIPFETFANRISGSLWVFFPALLGTVLMIIRYPVMMLSLPMLGLGFLAYFGSAGLRFTVYAVPVMALGVIFLSLLAARFLPNIYTRLAFFAGAAALVLWPNIQHVTRYMTPTVFTSAEVAVLDQLKKIADREDYVLTWWDYGYPIRYYSDVKTLVDGGKHNGDVNFPVSFALTTENIHAAVNMARLNVEMTEKAFSLGEIPGGNHTAMAMLEHGFKDANAFLKALEDPAFPLPGKSREVYFYLPFRMAQIYPTVQLFSNLNLMDGSQHSPAFFRMFQNFQETPDQVLLPGGIALQKQTGLVKMGNQGYPLHSVTHIWYDTNGQVQRQNQVIRPEGNLRMVFLRDFHAIFLLDEKAWRSTYVQLFLMENYDPELFEPVILTPAAKVYRLKR